uniref:Putative basic tail protein n=1 Tax=Amblyomma cajennense TaxID=34607 RepID=A0A023FTL2_AMBCJ
MAILGLLCVFFLQALHASADIVRGCPPKEPEGGTTVENCNYYCGQDSQGQWIMGYYVNGTKCKYSDTQDGYCVEVPDNEGCHPDNSQYVLDFSGTLQPPRPCCQLWQRRNLKVARTPKAPKSRSRQRNQRRQRNLRRQRNQRIPRKRNPRPRALSLLSISEELCE